MFRVKLKDADGETVREVRSITGARRAVTNDLLALSDAIVDDDTLWAGRTQKLQRERIHALNDAAVDMLRYDGPIALTLEGKTWAIEQDADAPTRTQKKAANARGPKWLESVRFPNDCAGGCGTRIQQGAVALYDAPRLYCEPCGTRIKPRAVAA
jgi:hypothetical protein